MLETGTCPAHVLNDQPTRWAERLKKTEFYNIFIKQSDLNATPLCRKALPCEEGVERSLKQNAYGKNKYKNF